jgi:hypothetical protein
MLKCKTYVSYICSVSKVITYKLEKGVQCLVQTGHHLFVFASVHGSLSPIVKQLGI